MAAATAVMPTVTVPSAIFPVPDIVLDVVEELVGKLATTDGRHLILLTDCQAIPRLACLSRADASGRDEQQNSPRPATSSLPPMNSARCLATMAPSRSRRASVGVFGIEANEIAVIDELAAGLAAGVEARIAARALAMQSKEAEALDRTHRRRHAPRREPALEDCFAERQEFICNVRRGRDESGVRRRNDGVKTRGNIVKAFDGRAGHQPNPRARSNAEESERFSCTPTLRAERPSAMPRS